MKTSKINEKTLKKDNKSEDSSESITLDIPDEPIYLKKMMNEQTRKKRIIIPRFTAEHSRNIDMESLFNNKKIYFFANRKLKKQLKNKKFTHFTHKSVEGETRGFQKYEENIKSKICMKKIVKKNLSEIPKNTPIREISNKKIKKEQNLNLFFIKSKIGSICRKSKISKKILPKDNSFMDKEFKKVKKTSNKLRKKLGIGRKLSVDYAIGNVKMRKDSSKKLINRLLS